MKTFRYPLGHVAGSTMTVGELRAKLAEYTDDMPVFAEWEGVHAYVTPDHFFVEHDVGKGYEPDHCACLLISVDQY